MAMLHGQGKMEVTPGGGKRESSEGRGRFDLLPFEAVEAWAKWMEEGAKKYGDRNWEEGLSVKDTINRMVRHAVKAANGWTDEDHLAAVMCNAAIAITMMQRRPDLDDHPWKTGELVRSKTIALDRNMNIIPSQSAREALMNGIESLNTQAAIAAQNMSNAIRGLSYAEWCEQRESECVICKRSTCEGCGLNCENRKEKYKSEGYNPCDNKNIIG